MVDRLGSRGDGKDKCARYVWQAMPLSGFTAEAAAFAAKDNGRTGGDRGWLGRAPVSDFHLSVRCTFAIFVLSIASLTGQSQEVIPADELARVPGTYHALTKADGSNYLSA